MTTVMLWGLVVTMVVTVLSVLLAKVTRSPAYQRWRYLGEHDRVFRPERLPEPPPVAAPAERAYTDVEDDAAAFAEHAEVQAAYRDLVDELYDFGERTARRRSAP